MFEARKETTLLSYPLSALLVPCAIVIYLSIFRVPISKFPCARSAQHEQFQDPSRRHSFATANPSRPPVLGQTRPSWSLKYPVQTSTSTSIRIDQSIHISKHKPCHHPAPQQKKKSAPGASATSSHGPMARESIPKTTTSTVKQQPRALDKFDTDN